MISGQHQNQFQQHEMEQFGLFAGRHPIPLKSTSFTGQLKGMMTSMAMKMVFENVEDKFIEAVYTFPIPDGAVFLGLSIEMAGQAHQTVVMERKEATNAYEESVTDGNAAILVEEVSSNLYSMQIGNIPPEADVKIEYKYSVLLEWRDGLLRWRLPTVLAPLYGQSGLALHHEPEIDLLTKHKFKFELCVEGFLSELPCMSPSHQMKFIREGGVLKLTLGYERDVLNRDLIIHFQQNDRRDVDVCSALWDRDINNDYCALLSLCTPSIADKESAPKIIKILIDCSGSMIGESIKQARIALRQVIQEMRPEDKLMVWKFGSSVEKLQKRPVNINKVDENIFHRIQADLGGTELFKALTSIAKQGNTFSVKNADVFLITDGEVWNEDFAYSKLIDALGNKQRVFSVGVGRAVSTEALNNLAKDTGGSVELVTPNEKMATRITSHFKRMYAPRLKLQNINWSTPPDYVDEYPAIFSGDTAYIGARFKLKPEGEITINATYDDGRSIVWACRVSDKAYETDTEGGVSALARTIAARQMTKADKGISLKLALDYQLLSDKTACYVEVNLSENQQSDGQPEIRKVPSMLASGYGGISENQCGLLLNTLDLPFEAGGTRYLEMPACLRRANESIEPKSHPIADALQPEISGIDDEHLVLGKVEQFYNRNNRLPLNEIELLQCGLDEKLIGELLIGYTTDEEIARAIALFLYKQLQSLSEAVSRSFSREIRVIAKQREALAK
jgi:Ca-activated chloride channel family protein